MNWEEAAQPRSALCKCASYTVEQKLIEYQRRGDAEICRIHPHQRTLIAWLRQPDGTYTETLNTSGSIQPAFLPNVTIDLESLFE